MVNVYLCIVAEADGNGRAHGGKGLCLADMGEACMSMGKADDSERLYAEALTALNKALELTDGQADPVTKAQYHKAVCASCGQHRETTAEEFIEVSPSAGERGPHLPGRCVHG
jgi:hypothetical protein